MLGQRRRRRANIKSTLVQRLGFAERTPCQLLNNITDQQKYLDIAQQSRDISGYLKNPLDPSTHDPRPST